MEIIVNEDPRTVILFRDAVVALMNNDPAARRLFQARGEPQWLKQQCRRQLDAINHCNDVLESANGTALLEQVHEADGDFRDNEDTSTEHCVDLEAYGGVDSSDEDILRELIIIAKQGIPIMEEDEGNAIQVLRHLMIENPKISTLQHCSICGGLGNITTCPYNIECRNSKPHLHLSMDYFKEHLEIKEGNVVSKATGKSLNAGVVEARRLQTLKVAFDNGSDLGQLIERSFQHIFPCLRITDISVAGGSNKHYDLVATIQIKADFGTEDELEQEQLRIACLELKLDDAQVAALGRGEVVQIKVEEKSSKDARRMPPIQIPWDNSCQGYNMTAVQMNHGWPGAQNTSLAHHLGGCVFRHVIKNMANAELLHTDGVSAEDADRALIAFDPHNVAIESMTYGEYYEQALKAVRGIEKEGDRTMTKLKKAFKDSEIDKSIYHQCLYRAYVEFVEWVEGDSQEAVEAKLHFIHQFQTGLTGSLSDKNCYLNILRMIASLNEGEIVFDYTKCVMGWSGASHVPIPNVTGVNFDVEAAGTGGPQLTVMFEARDENGRVLSFKKMTLRLRGSFYDNLSFGYAGGKIHEENYDRVRALNLSSVAMVEPEPGVEMAAMPMMHAAMVEPEPEVEMAAMLATAMPTAHAMDTGAMPTAHAMDTGAMPTAHAMDTGAMHTAHAMMDMGDGGPPCPNCGALLEKKYYAAAETAYNYECPVCGKIFKRERVE